MKKNKVLKYIIITLLFFLICVFLYNTISIATTIDPDDYKPNPLENNTNFSEKANLILGAIQVVGSIVSVIALVVIGIKYMIGSVEEKAEYKKTMLPYLIGIILLFGASNLVQIIYDLGVGIN